MKTLDAVEFDYALTRQQVSEFRDLLASKTELSESQDILPFFRPRQHLAILLGMFNPRIARADRIAYEFDIFGDFSCDLAVGEWNTGSYCFIEFEDASADNVFKKKERRPRGLGLPGSTTASARSSTGCTNSTIGRADTISCRDSDAPQSIPRWCW